MKHSFVGSSSRKRIDAYSPLRLGRVGLGGLSLQTSHLSSITSASTSKRRRLSAPPVTLARSQHFERLDVAGTLIAGCFVVAGLVLCCRWDAYGKQRAFLGLLLPDRDPPECWVLGHYC